MLIVLLLPNGNTQTTIFSINGIDRRGAKILLVFYTEKEDTCDYNSFTKIPEYTELVIFEHTALVM